MCYSPFTPCYPIPNLLLREFGRTHPPSTASSGSLSGCVFRLVRKAGGHGERYSARTHSGTQDSVVRQPGVPMSQHEQPVLVTAYRIGGLISQTSGGSMTTGHVPGVRCPLRSPLRAAGAMRTALGVSGSVSLSASRTAYPLPVGVGSLPKEHALSRCPHLPGVVG
jgi:hypothetical protein